MTTYDIDVRTGKKSGAGTDANVFIIIVGDKCTTGKRCHICPEHIFMILIYNQNSYTSVFFHNNCKHDKRMYDYFSTNLSSMIKESLIIFSQYFQA